MGPKPVQIWYLGFGVVEAKRNYGITTGFWASGDPEIDPQIGVYFGPFGAVPNPCLMGTRLQMTPKLVIFRGPNPEFGPFGGRGPRIPDCAQMGIFRVA